MTISHPITDRLRLNGRVKRWSAVIGIPAAVLSIFVAWGQLDLPRPAWSSEVEQLADRSMELRSMVLNDIYLRRKRELAGVERQIWNLRRNGEQVPEWMAHERATLETEVEKLKRQLDNLQTEVGVQ